MTAFGFHSDSFSPARRRIEAAAQAFLQSKKRNRVVPLWQRQEALRARRALIAAERRREQEHARRLERERWRREGPLRPAMTAILHDVAQRTGVSCDLLLKAGRSTKPAAAARQECFWRCHRSGYSLPTIGRFFGRHYTTVLEGVKKHGDRVRREAMARSR